MSAADHRVVPVQVWVDIDEGIADFVRHLNTLPGIRTHASCQGTINDPGAHEPYRAQVMVAWATDAALALLANYEMTPLGPNLAYVHPPPTKD